MGVLAALLVLFAVPAAPMVAAAEAPRISVVMSQAGEALPTPDGLRAGLQRLFAAEYGRFVSLSFSAPPQGAPVARIDISRSSASTVTVATTLTQGTQGRTLRSAVPAGSPMSLSAAMAGDLAFLYFSSQDFAAFPPAPPPSMTALLPTDAVADLLGAKGDDREPIGITSGGEGITVTFPHGYVSLGPLFRMTTETARDLAVQAGAREQMQLSSVARSTGDDLFLLSQDSGRIALVNPQVGSREVLDAPGLSAVQARVLDEETVADLSGGAGPAAVTLYRTQGSTRLALGDFYASTFSVDGEGNLWVWDIAERRIRIFTRAGTEVFSIKPLLKPSLMPIPQQLEVLDDGSFLLAGSGEVWRFERTGIPVWRLTRIPGRPGDALPPSFALAADRADGSFVLLDAPSRRLLSFGPGPGNEDLGGFYARLDQRRPEDLQEGAGLAKDRGLSLVELTFATLLSQRGGTPAAAAAARLDVLRDRARLSLQVADRAASDLLDGRADAAYLRAGEAARALSAAAPDDQEAAANLTTAAARRQELRAALAPGSGFDVLWPEVHVTRAADCTDAIEVRLVVRNYWNGTLTDVRVHANLPTTTLGPALTVLDTLGPLEEQEIVVRLATAAEAAMRHVRVPLAVRVTAQRASEGMTSSFLLTAGVTVDASSLSAADILACMADPSDPLVQSLPDALLGAARQAADPFGAVSAVFGMTLPAAAASDQGAGAGSAGTSGLERFSVRQALRSLDQSELSRIVVMGSLAASQGLRAGFLAWPDQALLLVDTGVALEQGIAASPALAPYRAVLAKLARNGTLCLPFAATTPLRSAESAAAGLQDCARRGMDGASVSWLDTLPARDAVPRPVPFPIALPAAPPNDTSTHAFFTALGAALAALRPS